MFAKKLLPYIFLSCAVLSCGKNKFLSALPGTEVTIPVTLENFQALLDNNQVLNNTPVLLQLSDDDYYMTNSYWDQLLPKDKNAYIWAPDIFQEHGNITDWNLPYTQVLHANVVLDGLPGIPVTNSNRQQWDNIRGTALFTRAYAFYNLASAFAPAYDHTTSATDMGIPLRLKAAVTEKTVRASVKETYAQILKDLTEAVPLLPAGLPAYNRRRPCQPAAYALLARVCLSMRDYNKALLYADSCLKLYNQLLDYNQLVLAASAPFPQSNPEVLYQSITWSPENVLLAFVIQDCITDSMLFRSYNANDLRLQAFFTSNNNNLPVFKGSYHSDIFLFSGLATDEVCLVRAECLARAGKTAEALQSLNNLLQHRWKAGTFAPVTAASATEALQLILAERRKELLMRGLRWADIKRLNKENASIDLVRQLNGQRYLLPHNDPRFILPIPPDVIIRSGIPQNNR